jgi:hypothetical protein
MSLSEILLNKTMMLTTQLNQNYSNHSTISSHMKNSIHSDNQLIVKIKVLLVRCHLRKDHWD